MPDSRSAPWILCTVQPCQNLHSWWPAPYRLPVGPWTKRYTARPPRGRPTHHPRRLLPSLVISLRHRAVPSRRGWVPAARPARRSFPWMDVAYGRVDVGRGSSGPPLWFSATALLRCHFVWIADSRTYKTFPPVRRWGRSRVYPPARLSCGDRKPALFCVCWPLRRIRVWFIGGRCRSAVSASLPSRRKGGNWRGASLTRCCRKLSWISASCSL